MFWRKRLLLILANRSGGDQADLSLLVDPVLFTPGYNILQKAAVFIFHVLWHFFQKVFKVVVRIGAISFCCLDKRIHADRGFGPVRCVAKQPVAPPHTQIFETAFTELCEYSHNSVYPKELLIRIFFRIAALKADLLKKDAHKTPVLMPIMMSPFHF